LLPRAAGLKMTQMRTRQMISAARR